MRAKPPAPQVEEMVPLFYSALYRYAYRLTGSKADAEDLTQETFCSAQAKHAQLREPDRVKPWLFSILHNAFLLRKRRERQARFGTWDDWAESSASLDRIAGEPLVEEETLQAALLEVPPDFRSVLILYYFEDFSYRDIADQLAIPIGTVMSRLARARQFLKAQLIKRDAELGS